MLILTCSEAEALVFLCYCKFKRNIVEPLRKEFEKKPNMSNLVSLIDDFTGKIKQSKFLATFDHLS